MTELSNEALALLEAARRSHGPTQHERERVLGGLYASLGIAVPLALTASAAEAASAANLAANAHSAAAVQSAVVQNAGQAVVQNAGQAVLHGGATAGVAATGVKGGAWGLGVKLLSWNAGKVLLATLALGSAVGIGVHKLPRAAQDQEVEARTQAGTASAKGRATEAPSDPSAAVGTLERSDVPPPDERVPAARVAAQPTVQSAAAPQLPTGAPRADDNAAPPSAAAQPAVEPAGIPVVKSQPAALPVALEPVAALAATPSPAARSQRFSASHRASSTHSHRRRERASSSSALRSPVEPRASSSEAKLAAAAVAKPVASAPATTAPEPTTPIVTSAVAVDVVSAPAVATPQTTGELVLIRQALTSLRDRDATGALALLDEHAARYPSGAFATERRGLHVVALCAAGNLRDGRSEQAAFLRQAATSPIAPRVRRACEEPKK